MMRVQFARCLGHTMWLCHFHSSLGKRPARAAETTSTPSGTSNRSSKCVCGRVCANLAQNDEQWRSQWRAQWRSLRQSQRQSPACARRAPTRRAADDSSASHTRPPSSTLAAGWRARTSGELPSRHDALTACVDRRSSEYEGRAGRTWPSQPPT
jgi:hypothetical protein